MKHFNKIAVVVVALAAASVLFAFSGCSSSQESYTPPESTPLVSKPTISQDGTLRVGVNAEDGNAPLAGTTGKQKTVGIDVDVASALADELGLKVEIVNIGSNASSSLASGDVDVVMGVSKSDGSATYWTSDAYLPTSTALFSLSSTAASAPANDASTTIAVQVQTNSAWAVANEYDAATVTNTESLKAAFDALQSGQVKYVAADAVSGTYLCNNSGISAKPVALLQSASGYAVGVLDGNTKLKQVVSTAISNINSNGMGAIIQKKWLGDELDLSGLKVVSATTSDSSSNSSSSNSSNSTNSIMGALNGDGLSSSSTTSNTTSSTTSTTTSSN